MPKTIIRTLIEENSEFGAYFFANIADKLKNQSDNRRENELAGFSLPKCVMLIAHMMSYMMAQLV